MERTTRYFEKLGAVLTVIVGHHRTEGIHEGQTPKSGSVMDMLASVWLLLSDSCTVVRTMNKGVFVELSGSIDQWAVISRSSRHDRWNFRAIINPREKQQEPPTRLGISTSY
jgi:hypothetical protein